MLEQESHSHNGGGGGYRMWYHMTDRLIGGDLSLSIKNKTLLANMWPLEDKSMFSIKIYCLSGSKSHIL